tara:strand:+ start:882 stop:1061 length:180 start_codon:yes stop_codon:yes gene_type:complete
MEYKTPEHKRLKNLIHYYKYIKPDKVKMKERSDYALQKYKDKQNDKEFNHTVNHTVNFD